MTSCACELHLVEGTVLTSVGDGSAPRPCAYRRQSTPLATQRDFSAGSVVRLAVRCHALPASSICAASRCCVGQDLPAGRRGA